LSRILHALQAAAPKAKIAVMTCYEWAAVGDPASDRLVEQLDRTIDAAAAKAGVTTVDAFAAFNRIGDGRRRLCDLTLFCSPTHDLHPSDAGYRVMRDLSAKALAT